MQKDRYRILSTKEIAAELIASAAGQNIDITTQPFIHIQPLISDTLKERMHQLLQEKIYAVFTSANAVHTIREHYLHIDGRYYVSDGWAVYPPGMTQEEMEAHHKNGFVSPGWKVYCLEGATKQSLFHRPYGYSEWMDVFRHRIAGTARNATELAKLIVQESKTSSVVFFCGDKRRDELPEILKQHGIAVEEVIVYETTEVPVVIAENYDGIFFFSPSAVKSFFAVNKPEKHTICFAIGDTTARALEDYTDNRIVTGTRPEVDEMVQTAILYFNNINC